MPGESLPSPPALPSPVPVRDPGHTYSRKEVLRLLKIDNRQLRSWERQQLIPSLERYRFADMLLLKRIDKLRRDRAPARHIREAQQAIQELLRDSPHQESDVHVYAEGRRVLVKLGKQRLEPTSRQMLFDFSPEEIHKLLQLPPSQTNAAAMAERLRNKLEADSWFERGLELEGSGAPLDQIIEAYSKAAELDPQSACTLVNLGTVLFNGHAWADAEEQYKKALAVDPSYALAHFNLGNLYDEQDDIPNALHHYQQAIRLQPNYADAHYNLALLCQSTHDLLSAVRHWRAYLKLDSNSSWAQIARRELGRLEIMTVVPGNRGAAGKLQLVRTSDSGSDNS